MHEQTGQAVRENVGRDSPAPGNGLARLGTVRLNAEHDVKSFSSESTRVQNFIHNDDQRLISSGYCRVFVWQDPENPMKVLGFYSLAACSIEREELNNRFQRKTPGGVPAPMALIGFMGRSPDTPKGFGASLVHDAALRVSRIEDIPFWGLALHPENERLAAHYESLGSVRGSVWTKNKEKRPVMYGPLSNFLES